MKRLFFFLLLSIFSSTAILPMVAQAGAISGGIYVPKKSKEVPEVEEDSQPMGYETIYWLQGTLEDALHKVYQALGVASKPILYLTTGFVLVALIYKVVTGNPVPLPTLFSLLVTVGVLKTFILDWDTFYEWVYSPVISLMTQLPAFIMQHASSTMPSNTSDPLLYMFENMQDTLDEFMRIGSIISSQNSWWGEGAFFKGLLLQIVFLVLMIVFSYMYIIGIWSLHMLLFLLPLAMALAVAQKTRKYLINLLNHALTFMLVPVFASIAMAITLSLLDSLTSEALKLNITDKNVSTLPEYFYLKAITLGIFSIFFHLKSTSFASMVVGTVDSGFGQMFGAGISMATAGVSMVKNKAKNLGGGALQAATNNYGQGGGLTSSIKSGNMSQIAGYAAGAGAKKLGGGLARKGRNMLFGNTEDTGKS